MAKKVNKTVNDEIDIKRALVIVGVLVVIIGIIYGLTLGAQKIGWFDLRYVKPEPKNAIISYDNILAGTLFDRQSGEYYVMIADLDSDTNLYLNSLVTLYNRKKEKLNLYLVDLNNEMNKSIINDTSNPGAQSIEDLKISTPTLILIRDGKNVRYVEGTESIKTELGV